MNKYRHPRPLIRLLALAMLVLVLCTNSRVTLAQSTQPQPNQADSIHGIVVNGVTREPVGRALVYSSDNRFATMTDGEGRFEFTFPQAEPENNQGDESRSSNSSCISSEGGTACTTYPLPSQRPNRPQMLLARRPGFLGDQGGAPPAQPVTPGQELTLAMTPEALIVGRVTLPSSEASEAIQLEIYKRLVGDGRARWVRVGQASTKSSGEFRFTDLSAGNYKLLTRELPDRDPVTFDPRGQRYGYPPVYFPNATDFTAAQTIELGAGQIFQADISVVRQPYYQVKVAVTNPPRGAGIGVVVSAGAHAGPGYSLSYNDDDQMIEGLLPNGNYTLDASTYGRTALAGTVNISVKGAAVEGPRITLAPAASIPLNVKEEFTSGEEPNSPRMTIRTGQSARSERGPRRYLNVNLELADDFAEGRGASLRPPSGSQDDSLVMENVQPGRYWVRAYSSRGFVASITSGETDLLHEPLVVGGGSTSPIEITMRDDTAEIDGTVEGAAPPPNMAESPPSSFGYGFAAQSMAASSTHVYCVPLPDSSGEFRDLGVGPDAKFGPLELPPGTYRVLAFDRPQPDLEYRNPEAMRAYDAKGQLVRLIAGQKEHLRLQLISDSE
jgi:hypothetical protein